MAGFYDDMAEMAADLLARDADSGLGQGAVTLTRVIPGVVDPLQPWLAPADTTQTETLRAAVSGVSAKLVGTEVGDVIIVATDRVTTCAVPSTTYAPGDILAIDGQPVTVLAVSNIPAAGVAAAVRFIVR